MAEKNPAAPAPEKKPTEGKGGPRFDSWTVNGASFDTEAKAVVKVYEELKAGRAPFVVGVSRRGGTKVVLALKLVPDID